MRHQLIFRFTILLVLGCSLVLARAQVGNVRLNELLANNTALTNFDGTVTDLLELYNAGAASVNLAGCSLSDSNGYPRRYVFPAGTTISGRGYRVMIFDSGHAASGSSVPFGIKSTGGYLYFYDALTNLIDSVEYGLQPADYAIVRVDGTTSWVLITPSPGGTNIPIALGQHSALKINEWLADECNSCGSDWFEIYNATLVTISQVGRKTR